MSALLYIGTKKIFVLLTSSKRIMD
ncbi:hypothetical protein TSAR_008421 [Trichomalopsis sarcophagae]|uniref:Uncharacterized protein n=1 Tax=Trichomalopsis sarcophagae TaxID=543379 RepID=A0A232FEV3_9HYME|nr:hypothetical protein TSAR_008421 [Trichomalopsis sarcophagae]